MSEHVATGFDFNPELIRKPRFFFLVLVVFCFILFCAFLFFLTIISAWLGDFLVPEERETLVYSLSWENFIS